MKRLDMPATLQEIGVDEVLFKSKVNMLAMSAFEDQTTTANPRLPLISELEELLNKTYYGK